MIFSLPELYMNSFLNCLSCIILIGSQNTMTLMQQLQYLSASTVIYGTAPSKSVNPDRSEMCAAQCYFPYIQTFLNQGLPRRL